MQLPPLRLEAGEGQSPGWSNVFGGTSYRPSEKLLRAFLQKYRLVKMPDNCDSHGRMGGHSQLLHYTPGGGVSIRSGRYLSHRRGYGPCYVELQLDDYARHKIHFRFRGTTNEARVLFAGRQFKDDLQDIVHGKEHVIPAAHGVWSSFCKTVYANNPEVGGWNNFQRAHLSVVAVLEHMQQIGFTVEVNDEGDFWKDRNLAALAKAVGESDAMAAGMAAIRDTADGQQPRHRISGPGPFRFRAPRNRGGEDRLPGRALGKAGRGDGAADGRACLTCDRTRVTARRNKQWQRPL